MSLASARSSSLQPQHYHPVANILHWVIGAMIVLQFVLAKLDRTALQVGIGEWADTTWVGQFVTVVVHVETFE